MTTYGLNDNNGFPIDLKLDQLFNKNNGFFIELGANDGLLQSNTAFLEFTRKWTGILIEPSKNAFEKCIINRPNSLCLNYACVSNDYTEKYIKGDFNGCLMSSVNGKRMNNNASINCLTITLEKILNATKVNDIDLLSLDTEGYELNVLKGLNLNKYRPRYMLIEIYKQQYNEIITFLNKNNYRLLSNFTNYNTINKSGWDGTHDDYLFIDNQINNIDIITGEKFQATADLTIGSHNILTQYNQDFVKFDIKYLTLPDNFDIQDELIKFIDAQTKLFIYTEELPLFFNKIFPKLIKQKILLCHNSDAHMDEKYLQYIEDDKIIKIISQNVMIKHSKITCIPIGIANSAWSHGNLDALNIVKNMSNTKNKLCYFNFSIHTSPHHRQKIYDELKNEFEQNKQFDYQNYLIDLSKHKFCICPQGNGIDTHRFAECVYLGVIPIIQKDDTFSDYFLDNDVIKTKDWKNITKSFLENYVIQQTNKLLQMFDLNTYKI